MQNLHSLNKELHSELLIIILLYDLESLQILG